MTRTPEIQEIIDNADIVEIIRSCGIELVNKGKEYRGLCPFHDDSTPSMGVVPHEQFFKCHVCGAGGDIIKFVTKFYNIDFKEAVKKITGRDLGERANGAARPAPKPKPPPEPEREAIPPPDDCPPPLRDDVTAVWWYHTQSGRPWFCVARTDTGEKKPNGKAVKEFAPWTFTEEDGWKSKAIAKPRPLYNLHLLEQNPDKHVMLVEGEKCADAAGRMIPKMVAVTWPGGANSVRSSDFTPLRGRVVWVWPDPDAGGSIAAGHLREILEPIAAKVITFNVSDCESTFDAAEAESKGWDYERIVAWSNEMVNGAPRKMSQVKQAPAVRAALLPPAPAPEHLPEPPPKAAKVLNGVQYWGNCEWRDKLLYGGKDHDTPIKCIANACIVLRHAPEWRSALRWDLLFQCIRITRPLPWGELPDHWQGYHDTGAAEWFDLTRLHWGTSLVSEAAMRVAHENAFHPVRDYLTELKWDGKPRLSTWLMDYLHAPDKKFTRFVSAAWMISACARAMRPGCQVKTALVLFGPQDTGKSSALNILGGKWYGSQIGIIGGDSAKAREQANKLWIIENAELAATKKSDVDTVKDFISTNVDTYRPAYAKHVQEMPRSCVFAFTTNNDYFLSDETGNVRFWPIHVPSAIDLAGLKRDRDQLWAEAYARFESGEPYWITDESIRDEARDAAVQRVAQDEWKVSIMNWLARPEQLTRTTFTLGEIMERSLLIEAGRHDLSSQRRATNILRDLRMYQRRRGAVRVWIREGHEESAASRRSDLGDAPIASEYDPPDTVQRTIEFDDEP